MILLKELEMEDLVLLINRPIFFCIEKTLAFYLRLMFLFYVPGTISSGSVGSVGLVLPVMVTVILPVSLVSPS